MVRTRSGKATTSEENKEIPKIGKKIKSPQRSAMKSPKKSELASHVSFDSNVNDQPGKTYLKSPTVATSRNKGFSFPSLGGRSRWSLLKSSVKESPFFFVACLMAMCIIHYTTGALWVHQGGNTNTLFQFIFLVLAVHQVDIVANICNELLDGTMNSDSAFFFTEAGVNVSEVLLFLYSVHPTASPSFAMIALVVGLMFPVCWMNVRFMDDDKIWIRCLAYAVLIISLATNWESIMGNTRMLWYASLVGCAMIVDLFDLPDNYTPYHVCDGMVLLMRSAGCYMLITNEMLKGSRATMTVHESQVMRMLGF